MTKPPAPRVPIYSSLGALEASEVGNEHLLHKLWNFDWINSEECGAEQSASQAQNPWVLR